MMWRMAAFVGLLCVAPVLCAENCGRYKAEKDCTGQTSDGQECEWSSTDDKRKVCFPGQAMVATPTGDIQITMLEDGGAQKLLSPVPEDEVGAAETTSYMADAHGLDAGHETQELDFLALSHKTMKLGRPLILTPMHFLFVASPAGQPFALAMAKDVREGDEVLAFPDPQRPDLSVRSEVMDVKTVRLPGAFSPLTKTSLSTLGVENTYHALNGPMRVCYASGVPGLDCLRMRNDFMGTFKASLATKMLSMRDYFQ